MTVAVTWKVSPATALAGRRPHSTTGWMSRMGMRPITRLPYPVVIHRFPLGGRGPRTKSRGFSPVWDGPGAIAAFADQARPAGHSGVTGSRAPGREPQGRTATRMSALHSWVI